MTFKPEGKPVVSKRGPVILERSAERFGRWWIIETAEPGEVRLICYRESRIEVFQRWPSLTSARHAGQAWLEGWK